jgi:hypothetical protein
VVAKAPEFEGSFESNWGDWSASNGVWQIGIPKYGPDGAYEGYGVAGTNLSGKYPANTGSRLISPTIVLPSANAPEEIHLRFQQWFSFSRFDSGHVQIQVYNEGTGQWDAWMNISGAMVDMSPWSRKDIDISEYAGLKIRFGFFHTASRGYSPAPSESAGWYIDDIKVVAKAPEFEGSFESNWGDWSASNGVWQIGIPTSGPDGAYEGEGVAGTNLSGHYPPYTNSRLISPTMALSSVNASEEIHLRFQQWFSFSTFDSGQVQIQVYDEGTGQWDAWENIGDAMVDTSPWSRKNIDISAYAGRKVRVGFFHRADRDNYGASESTGWYIDDIKVVTTIVPEFEGSFSFESNWGDWSASNGVWQIGIPTSGPDGAYEGEGVAGTNLSGDYPAYTDSRLIGPTIILPLVNAPEKIHLSCWQWISLSRYDSGQLQIQVYDANTSQWDSWVNIGGVMDNTSDWTLINIDISAYAGLKVRFGFLHTADRDYSSAPSESAGWYIDDFRIMHISGFLMGQIFDSHTGEGISGVEITILENEDLFAKTDCDGNYIMLIYPGTYSVHFAAIDYKSDIRPVNNYEGEIKHLDFELIGLDSDGDGMSDPWEKKYGLNHKEPDDLDDYDEDDLKNLYEYEKHTDPTQWDTDLDNMSDGWEVQHNLNPREDDAHDDPDGDGFTNIREHRTGTNPHDKNSHPMGLFWLQLLLLDD